MKKIVKKLYIASTILIAAIIAVILGGLSGSSEVKAASALNVRFDVYLKSDFDTRSSFESDYGYAYEEAKWQVDAYDAWVQDNIDNMSEYGYTSIGECYDDADDLWSGTYFLSALDDLVTASAAGAAMFPNGWWNSVDWEANFDTYSFLPIGNFSGDVPYVKSTKSGKTTTYSVEKAHFEGSMMSYSTVSANCAIYEAAGPKTEFEPGQTIVIQPVVQGDNVGMVELYLDMYFTNGDGSKLTDSTGAAAAQPRNDFFSLDNDSWDVGVMKFTGDSAQHPYVRTGGEFATYNTSQSTGSSSDELYLLGIEVKIASTASGSFDITGGNTTSHGWITVNGDGGDFANMSAFNFGTSTISVEGASSSAGVSGVSVGSGTATKNSDGITIGTNTYDLWDATSQSTSTTSVNIVPTAVKGGTIDTVVYGTNINTLLTSGTSSTGSKGSYPITLGGTGTTTYVGIKTTSSDGSDTTWTILAIPRDSYTDAYLDNYSVTVTAGPSTSTKVVYDPTTFASGTKSYDVYVPGDAASLSFTPVFNSVKDLKMTCEVNGSTASSGVAVTGITPSGKITVVVTAQDGTTKTTYEFTIKTLSTDNSLTVTPQSGYTATYNASTKTYTINDVPFKTSSINVGFANAHGAIVKYDGSLAGTTETIAIPANAANAYAASTVTKTITVESQSGITETYTLVINRAAANANSDATFKVYDNKNNEITGTLVGNVWTASSDVEIDITGFYIIPTADTNAKGLSSMKFEGTLVASGAKSTTVSFGSATTKVPKSGSLVVTAEDTSTTTYTINVARRAFKTDTTYTYTIIDSNGADRTAEFAIDTNGHLSNLAQTTLFDTKITYINVTITPNETTTKVAVGSVDYTAKAYKLNVTAGTASKSGTATFKITPEATSSAQNVIVDVYSDTLNTNAYLKDVTIQGDVDTTAKKDWNYTAGGTLLPSEFKYTLDADVNGSGYILTLVPQNSRATIYVSTNLTTIKNAANKYTAPVSLTAGTLAYVCVVAEDGTTVQNYTVNVTTASNDNSVTVTPPAGYTASYDATTKTYTIDDVSYATAILPVVFTNSKGATIKLGSTTVSTGVTQNITIPNDTTDQYAATSVSTTISVTSQSGTTETYTLVINRVAANTNCNATFKVYDNNGDEITGTLSGLNWTADSEQDIDITGFYIVPTADSLAGGLSKMKFDGTIVASGANSKTISFGSGIAKSTKTASLVITAENTSSTTYTIEVSRRAYDTNVSYTWEVIDSDGVDRSSEFTLSGTILSNQSSTPWFDAQITYVDVTIKPSETKTKVTFGGIDKTNVSYRLAVAASGTAGYNSSFISYVVTPEAASSKVTHTIRVYSQRLEQDATLSDLVITGTVDTSATYAKHFATDGVIPSTIEFSIDKDTNGSKFNLDLAAKSSRATIYVSDDQNNINVPANLYTSTLELEIGKIYYAYVYAEDTTKLQKYTINVTYTDKRDKDPSIKTITVYGKDYANVEKQITTFVFDPTTGVQNLIKVPYSITDLRFDVVFNKPLSSLAKGNTNESLTGITTTTYTFQGQAENTDYKSMEYSIPVEREAGHTDNLITELYINGAKQTTFDPGNPMFAYLNSRNLSNVTVSVKVSDGARYTANFDTYSYQTSPFSVTGLTAGNYKILTISVESEASLVGSAGVLNMYQIYIFNADDNIGLNGISILEGDDTAGDLFDVATNSTYTFDPATKTNPFSISYSSENPYILVDTDGSYSTVSGDGNKVVTVSKSPTSASTKKATVTVTTEYGVLLKNAGFSVPADQSVSYVYNFTRNKASGNNALTYLEFTFGTENADKNASYNAADLLTTKNFKFENLGQNPTVTIDYTKDDVTATVTGLTDPDTGLKSGSSYESFVITKNGTQNIVLTVTAEDGSKNKYTFVFAQSTVNLDPNCGIKNIQLTGDTDTSDVLGYQATKKTYAVELRASNKHAVLNVTPESSYSSVLVDGNDFDYSKSFIKALDASGTTTIKVECVSQDGKNKETYDITITTPQPDEDNTLVDLKHVYSAINETIPGFAANKTDYTVHVPFEIEQYALVPTMKSAYATLVSNSAPLTAPLALSVGSNSAVVVVASEKGDTKTYTITVIRDADTKLDSLDIKSDGTSLIPSFDPETYVYNLPDVGYKVDELDLSSVTAGGSGVTMLINGSPATTGNNKVSLTPNANNQIKIEVIAASGALSTYLINVKRLAGSDDNTIHAYTTETGEVLTAAMLAGTTFNYVLPRTVDTFAPVFTIDSANGATYKLAPDADLVPGVKNVKTITVTSETGIDKVYTINVYTTDTEVAIKNIKLLDVEGGTDILSTTSTKVVYDKDTVTYNITIPWKTNSAYIAVTATNLLQNIYIKGTNVTDPNVLTRTVDVGFAIQPNVGTTTYDIYALSEFGIVSGDVTGTLTDPAIVGRSPIYKINITREAAKTDPRLATLVVKVGGVDMTLTPAFDSDIYKYTVDNVGNKSSVLIKATTIEASTSILPGTCDTTLTLGSGEANKTWFINTVAENGDTASYEITIYREKINLADDNELTGVTLEDSEGKSYIDSSYDWAANGYKASVVIDSAAKYIEIETGKLAKSPAEIFFTQAGSVVQHSDTKLVYKSNITADMYANKVIYTVYAVSELGTKGQEYEIEVTFTEQSADASVLKLMIDGVLVPGFDPDIHDYDLGVIKNSREDVQLTYVLSDSKASVIESDSTLGKVTLTPGVAKTLKLVVKAENGTIVTYTVKVTRDEANPYLDNIVLGDSLKLLDNQANEVQFSKTNTTYYVSIKSETLNVVTIDAFYSNPSYNLSVGDNAFIRATADGKITFKTDSLDYKTYTIVITVDNNKSGELYKATDYTLVITKINKNTDTSLVGLDVIKKTGEGDNGVKAPDFVFDAEKNTYSISVDNKYTFIDIKPTVGNPASAGEKGTTYTVNGQTDSSVVGLVSGMNYVVVKVTSADGSTTRFIEVFIDRAPMNFTVVNDAVENFELKTIDASKYQYSLKMGTKKASKLTADEWKSYIDFDKNTENLTISVVSDITNSDCSEVVLSITDGVDTELVTITLERTLPTTSLFDFKDSGNLILWLILLIAIILLITILVSVNKDKYGNINKARKKESK